MSPSLYSGKENPSPMKLPRSVVVAAVAAVVLVPSAAHADSYKQVDAVGDVQSSPMSGSVAFTPTPDRVTGDVTYTKITHRARVIKVKIAFRDLDRAGPNAQFMRFKSNRLNREVGLLAYPGTWRGKAAMSTFSDKKVSCNLRHDIDYVANTVVVNVPRSCLGNPRWVRVAIGSATYDETTIYADDARSATLPDYWVHGPKVRR